MTNPIWVVKTRMCLKDISTLPEHMRYRNFRDGIYKLIKYEGLSGMYKVRRLVKDDGLNDLLLQGLIPGLVGVSHGVVQFVTYDEMKKCFCNYYNIPISSKLVSKCNKCVCCVYCVDVHMYVCVSVFKDKIILFQGTFHYLVMASSSKVVAVSVTYPYQVVRARLQVTKIAYLSHCKLCPQDQQQRYTRISDIITNIIRLAVMTCILHL